MSYKASCHCREISVEVKSTPEHVIQCNCSICTKKGFLHWIVKKDQVRFISGKESIRDYQFNTKTAHHYFCPTCGVSPLYIPRSHPDSYSVNFRCFDNFDELSKTQKIVFFDGQNWESEVDKIK